jgi:hypothetical protein
LYGCWDNPAFIVPAQPSILELRARNGNNGAMIPLVSKLQKLGVALGAAILISALLCCSLWGQNIPQPTTPSNPRIAGNNCGPRSLPKQNNDAMTVPTPSPIVTVHEKWNYFLHETASPLTFAGGSFNALFSQATRTDPQYGTNGAALAKRFGASLADIGTENFFGDFAAASVFHEDPRYFRLGEGHGFWRRAGYAISRAVVIRKDSSGNQFNFDNFIGSAGSSVLSNLYYPPSSRTGKAFLMHFGIDVADDGFVNLAPEFWPDFRRKFFGWIH